MSTKNRWLSPTPRSPTPPIPPLREICGGLATALGKLTHLGLKGAPARSTLSYANNHRPWQLFETVFLDLRVRCQDVAAVKGRRFRFKNPLRSLDSTTIDLCAEVFDWAKFRRTKGAVKLHLQLDHQGCLPCWALVTDGKTHDVKAAQGLSFAPGTIVAMDRTTAFSGAGRSRASSSSRARSRTWPIAWSSPETCRRTATSCGTSPSS